LNENNALVSKVSKTISELENKEILRDIELTQKAKNLIIQSKGDKERTEKLQLGLDDIEKRLLGNLQTRIPGYSELKSDKDALDEKRERIRTQIKTWEGLALIKETSEYIERIQASEAQLKELDELVQKTKSAIEAFEERAGKLSNLPPQVCENLKHPGKKKRPVQGKRGETFDRWYCDICKKFVDNPI